MSMAAGTSQAHPHPQSRTHYNHYNRSWSDEPKTPARHDHQSYSPTSAITGSDDTVDRLSPSCSISSGSSYSNRSRPSNSQSSSSSAAPSGLAWASTKRKSTNVCPSPLPSHMKQRQLDKLACLFCRGRKIACGAPPPGSVDKTCKYVHFFNTSYNLAYMLVFMQPMPSQVATLCLSCKEPSRDEEEEGDKGC